MVRAPLQSGGADPAVLAARTAISIANPPRGGATRQEPPRDAATVAVSRERRDDVHETEEATSEILTRLANRLQRSRLAMLEAVDGVRDY